MGTFDTRPRLLLSAFVMNTSSHILGGQWRHPEAQQHRFNELSAVDRPGPRAGGGEVRCDVLRRRRRPLRRPRRRVGLPGAKGPAGSLQRSAGALLRAGGRHQGHRACDDELGHPVRSLPAGPPALHAGPYFQRPRGLEHRHQRAGELAPELRSSGLTPHDDRYDWAEEYIDAVYKLWEGSWEDDALLADKNRGIYADPAKVNKIHHRGARYSIEGPHLVSPSPQRTPFLFQAGSSARGRCFAAANAEATFLFAPNVEYVAKQTASIRALEPGGRARRAT